MPRDAFALKIQRGLCHPKCAGKMSGLSTNGPLEAKSIELDEQRVELQEQRIRFLFYHVVSRELTVYSPVSRDAYDELQDINANQGKMKKKRHNHLPRYTF